LEQALKGKDLKGKSLEVIEERGGRAEPFTEEQVERLAALGQAISDPMRVRMLGMMAEGRSCCELTDLGVPAGEGEQGICICEFEDYFGMGQSKVSYHMGRLREAGLIHEEKRGKWKFYSLDTEAARELLGETGVYLGIGRFGGDAGG
jgi:ArsR family transcriptional regulator, arsenate/arsenite/antimonite-responsive transcriptional repressor